MPRKPTGNAYQSKGRWYARVRLDGPKPESIPLPTCTDPEGVQARARALVLAELADDLRAAGFTGKGIAEPVQRAAAALTDEDVGTIRRKTARALDAVKGAHYRAKKQAAAGALTVRKLGEQWTSGALHRDWPDHVPEKRSAKTDEGRLEAHVYPIVEDTLIEAFTLEHAQSVMRAIPEERSAATRRHVAQLLHRLLGFAVFPLRIIAANPLPKGFLPNPASSKQLVWLWPDEDAALCASPKVPLAFRVLYGFLCREGCRLSEALGLCWHDVDLERGTLALDQSKTEDARAWALDPGVVRALVAWKKLRKKKRAAGDNDPVFVLQDENGEPVSAEHAAHRFRTHLKRAEVTRPVLFETNPGRQPIRVHDLRATFVTLSLAQGRSEAWVMDRTGHRSSQMLGRYRRAARSVAELGLGGLRSLDLAIPELVTPGQDGTPGAESANESANRGGSGGGGRRRKAGNQDSRPRGETGRRSGLKSLAPSPVASETQQNTANSEGDPPPSRGRFADSDGPFADSTPPTGTLEINPRGAILERLFALAGQAAATGDIGAARVAYRAIGELLGEDIGEIGAVVDLASARKERGR